jgi:hypothetical protein
LGKPRPGGKVAEPEHSARRGVKAQKSKDVKMQERSHQVIENKESGLGSFAKRTQNCGTSRLGIQQWRNGMMMLKPSAGGLGPSAQEH